MMVDNLIGFFSIAAAASIHEPTEPHWVLMAFYAILAAGSYVVLCFMAKEPAPPHKNLLIKIYFGCLAIMVAAGLFTNWHISFSWEKPIAAFFAIFGFIGCVFLIYFAKGLRLWLPKEEDYYEKMKKEGGEEND